MIPAADKEKDVPKHEGNKGAVSRRSGKAKVQSIDREKNPTRDLGKESGATYQKRVLETLYDIYLITQEPYVIDIRSTQKNIEDKIFMGVCVESQKRIPLDYMSINLLSDNNKRKLRVFFSYSHKDERYRDELEIHMAMLKRSGRIETWHDRKIVAGEDWDAKIKHELENADLVLLMISPDFLNSNYIMEQELGVLRNRIEDAGDDMKVVPIFTRPCDTTDFDIMTLQGAQQDTQSKLPYISVASDRDEVYAGIVKRIRAVIDGIK